MHVLAIRRPGQRGTRKLLARYGERLICVRYRYDAASKTRYKTVELVVDQAPGLRHHRLHTPSSPSSKSTISKSSNPHRRTWA